MKLTIRPLTPDLWLALEHLFGKGGASNGCWCMYWRIGPAYGKRPRERNRVAFRRIVKAGSSPGLLAFDGGLAVGWCQLTPRHALSWPERARLQKRVDDVPVWSLSCFYTTVQRVSLANTRRHPSTWSSRSATRNSRASRPTAPTRGGTSRGTRPGRLA